MRSTLIALLLVAGVRTDTAQAQTLVEVSAGASHNCSRASSGEVQCWGMRAMGRLSVPAGRYQQMDAGGGNTCAIREDGSVACWGVTITAVHREPEGRFARLSVGDYAACGIRATDGGITCWGGSPSAVFGSTGNWGRAVREGIPQGRFTEVSVGFSHACALTPEGRARCWGESERIGDVPAGRLHGLSVGVDHACALDAGGRAVCWGRRVPSIPEDAPTFTELSVGYFVTCGITRSGGELRCYGSGDATRGVPEGSGFQSVSVDDSIIDPHACAIRRNGEAVCWGDGHGSESP